MRSRPLPLLAAVWLVGVGLATGTGVLAVQLVAKQVGGPTVTVLSSSDVNRALESASTRTSTAGAEGSEAPARQLPGVHTPAPTASSAAPQGAGAAHRPPSVSTGASGPARTAAQQSGKGSPSAARSGRAPAPAASQVEGFDSEGGSVGVRCRGTAPEQVYATPAQGYRVDDSSVNGDVLEVRFDSSTDAEVRLQISCATGRPVLVDRTGDDNSGSGSGLD